MAIRVFFTVACICCEAAFAQWENKTIEAVTDDSLYNMTCRNPVHLDNNGRLYTAYYEVAGGITRVYFNIRDSLLGWGQPVEVPVDTSIGQLGSLNLAVDKLTGQVWLAHNGILFSESASYVWLYRFFQDTVEILKIDTSKTGTTGHVIDMQFDPLGNLHMAWYRALLSQQKKYAVYALYHAGVWSKQAVGDTTPHLGGSISPTFMSVTRDGRVYMRLSPDFLRNDTLGGATWEKVNWFVYPHPYRILNDVEIDTSENVHVLWEGYDDPDGQLFYLYYQFRDSQTGLWGAPELLSTQGAGWSLTLDSLGEPHAAWQSRLDFGYYVGNLIYGNKKSGSWTSAELITDVFQPIFFDFLIDGAGNGHGIFRGFKSGAFISESTEIFYVRANPLDVKRQPGDLPKSFELLTNYPNPFNSTTLITYTISASSQVTLKVYNIRGQLVTPLMNQFQRPGTYSIAWNGTNDDGKSVSSGIYFCKLSSGTFFEVKKMLLLR